MWPALKQEEKEYSRLLREFEDLSRQNSTLKTDILDLEDKAAKIIALYDTTKEISKFLDFEVLFKAFQEKLKYYLEITDCKYLGPAAGLEQYGDYTVLPMEIEAQILGYLAVKGIKEQEMDKLQILSQQFLLGIKRAWLYKKLQELSITDSLTGILNRRFFEVRAEEEILRSRQFNLEFCLFLLDVDYFKTYNDRYGHLVGDVVLKEASRAIKENIRQIDLLGRYGGDEFVLLLTETNLAQAEFVAERIRKAIAAKMIKAYDEELQLSVSIGGAFFPAHAQDFKALIEKADQALYRAKESGKNKYQVFS
ncbi:MAG: GGDEF domain-containing protein [Candidatus Omnitrophica bacterium]|nr:GGDEF domain-containing protein [Candidatus Omnitrophota bacterium]MDD5653464.1 GGDEF domain-containing protein [Candidatus Omnitrophota bacterium]